MGLFDPQQKQNPEKDTIAEGLFLKYQEIITNVLDVTKKQITDINMVVKSEGFTLLVKYLTPDELKLLQ